MLVRCLLFMECEIPNFHYVSVIDTYGNIIVGSFTYRIAGNFRWVKFSFQVLKTRWNARHRLASKLGVRTLQIILVQRRQTLILLVVELVIDAANKVPINFDYKRMIPTRDRRSLQLLSENL